VSSDGRTRVTGEDGAQPERPANAVVFAPSPLLTVTIECKGDQPDIHLHPGGQGFWFARMIAALGLPVTLCGSFGGETGAVVRTLMEHSGVAVRGVDADAGNAAYVHDRRSGERVAVAQVRPAPLSRHDVDELYAMTLVEGLDAAVCVLGGPAAPDVLPPDTYRRLASDLSRSGRLVVADLSGEPLHAALKGGLSVLKISHEELLAEGLLAADRTDEIIETMRSLQRSGAQRVVVSHGNQPALALNSDNSAVEIVSPRVEPVDVRGAGDAMTAGLAAALARGYTWEAALRLGAAAGTLNVTRRGLATGTRREIERLATHVRLRPPGAHAEQPPPTTVPNAIPAPARPS